MNQLTFKFPFSKKFYEQDYFVSSNNFSAFKLIEDWPNWPGRWLNIFGEKGSGKTHLTKILEKKIKKSKLVEANKIDNKTLEELYNLKENRKEGKKFKVTLNTDETYSRIVEAQDLEKAREKAYNQFFQKGGDQMKLEDQNIDIIDIQEVK